MDAFYNIEAASHALSRLASERTGGNASTLQLSTYDQGLPSNISALATKAPAGMRLMIQEEADEENHETVLRVQGALCFTELPPIRSGMRLPDRGEPRFMKQSVRITGLGGDDFKHAIQGLAKLGAFMGENLEHGDIENWKCDRFRTWQALDISNRLFTFQNSEGDMSSVPFAVGVDPEGILAAIAGDKWVHTEDNVVMYSKLGTRRDGKPKYTPIKPADFKIGDLIEAQFSPLTVRRRGKNEVHSFKLVLRALTLLEDVYSKAARENRLLSANSEPTSPSRGVKRTVGYMDEEDGVSSDVPTNKMTKLSIKEVVMAERAP